MDQNKLVQNIITLTSQHCGIPPSLCRPTMVVQLIKINGLIKLQQRQTSPELYGEFICVMRNSQTN